MDEEQPWVQVKKDDTPIEQMTIMPGLEPTTREKTRNRKLSAWFPTVESISRVTVEQFRVLTGWSKDRAYALQEETLKSYGVTFTPLSKCEFMRLGIIRPSLRVNLYRLNLYTVRQLEALSLNELLDMIGNNPKVRISAVGIAAIENAMYSKRKHWREEPLDGYNLWLLRNRKDGTAIPSAGVNSHDLETGLPLLDDEQCREVRKRLLLDRRGQLLEKLDLIDEELVRLAPGIELEFRHCRKDAEAEDK
ncbi:hypothetical protein [Bifidobacterium sp. SO1]|uniref:hypothetical protein n=1 Tax=Bifidobacterium sp. SO1 TaxID=2809029 RepID=UPI001BDD8E51|nr:hypothetical protein [Bifidobacterium sp. SO1]MBT1162567.1 hypothetical protein [Bifidobacterium sp. SO1]